MRVVLADDAAVIRQGLARVLAEAGVDAVAEVGDGPQLLRAVDRARPDVAIVDIRMPPTGTDEGLRAAREIRERHPGTGVLVLSQHLEPAYAMRLVSESAEGLGYLLKDRIVDLDEFASAVRRVARGGSALDSKVVSQLMRRERPDDPVNELTQREREVLHVLAEARGRTVRREAIYRHVWGYTMARGDRSVDVNVRRLRAKLLHLEANEIAIRTHPGVGYRLEVATVPVTAL